MKQEVSNTVDMNSIVLEGKRVQDKLISFVSTAILNSLPNGLIATSTEESGFSIRNEDVYTYYVIKDPSKQDEDDLYIRIETSFSGMNNPERAYYKARITPKVSSIRFILDNLICFEGYLEEFKPTLHTKVLPSFTK